MNKMKATSEEVHLSALERAKRTLLPALGVDVAVAVALVLEGWVGDADLASGDDWRLLAILVGKSVIASVAAYVLRLRREPEFG